MKISGKPITIGSDLPSHLFVNAPCPKCGSTALASLDMMRTQHLRCTQCKSILRYDLGFEELGEFADGFAHLYERLQRVGLLPLLLFLEPNATTWSRGNKP